MKADDILAALRLRHPIEAWVFFAELRVGTGFGGRKEQRLDAWAMHCWPSAQYRRIAYEIKVTKSDMQHEIENPQKRQAALSLSNEFYWAIPSGLETPLLPAEAGLIVVDERGAHVARKAPYRESPLPPLSFLASVARRAMLASKGGGSNIRDFISHGGSA